VVRNKILTSAVSVLFLFALAGAVHAQTDYIWDDGGDGFSWTDPINWNPDGIPGTAAGDTAYIRWSASVQLLAAPANPLSGLTITDSASLTLEGAAWTLDVTSTLGSGSGAVILGDVPGSGDLYFDDNDGAGAMITLACNSMTVNANGTVGADGNGYAGGTTGTSGQGIGGGSPGGSAGEGGGGGGYAAYGGSGSLAIDGGPPYGSLANPVGQGSGGGGDAGAGGGGAGGGRMRLIVSGTLTVSGSISANGSAAASGGGGGAGGTVRITAGTVAGTGLIKVDGGAGSNSGGEEGGGGSGGRIAVDGYSGAFGPSVSAVGGAAGGVSAYPGGAGTIVRTPSGQDPNLILDNGGQPFGGGTVIGSFQFGSVAVVGNAFLKLEDSGNPVLFEANGNFTLENSEVKMGFGDRIRVQGTLTIPAGRTAIVHWYDGSFGGNFHVMAANANIFGQLLGEGVGFNGGANGGNGTGPAGGIGSGANGGGGGGHGGTGGDGDIGAGGPAYGSTTAPLTMGSGGGSTTGAQGGAGGGAVSIIVTGTIQVAGTVSVNGTNGASGGGGGAGGSIFFKCDAFARNGCPAECGKPRRRRRRPDHGLCECLHLHRHGERGRRVPRRRRGAARPGRHRHHADRRFPCHAREPPG
jgi:hypothetical protein